MTKPKLSEWNAWRAETAGEALALFAEITGGQLEFERNDIVGDLLCNLGHYCDQHGLDWDALVARAGQSIDYERIVGDEEYGDQKPPLV